MWGGEEVGGGCGVWGGPGECQVTKAAFRLGDRVQCPSISTILWVFQTNAFNSSFDHLNPSTLLTIRAENCG